MIEKVSDYIVCNYLYKGENVSNEQKEIMNFGVTRIIEDIPKILVIFIISYLLKILPFLLVSIIINFIYKSFIGGAHARTNILCLVLSTMFFIFPCLLVKFITIPQYLLYIFYIVNLIFSSYIIIKRAPADTEEVPILKESKRKKLRIFASLSLGIVYILCFFVIKDIKIQSLVMINVFLINLNATKLIYKMLHCKTSIESEEFKDYFINKI